MVDDSGYVKRPLAEVLGQAKRKVVVLEGARAVGKTMMVREQLVPQGYSYVSLADANTYALAQVDIRGWLAQLKLPVVIDEAQRIKTLPLAVKELVDSLDSGGPLIILTGSALIDRKGLDGQDPLARRAQHYTMSPLTRREFEDDSASIVDDLWQADPDTNYDYALDRSDLYNLMAAGGFPDFSRHYTEYEDWEREQLIADDLRAVLGDTILPGEKLDLVIAGNIMNRLLTQPGGILNASALGSDLAIDRRTVDRYLGVFLRRFLVHALPNLRTAPNRQSVARSKIHPVDTSLSVQTLLGKGRDPLTDPVAFGGILESFVVNQIVPAVQWSHTHPDCFYWREGGAKPKEVDLVMLRRDQLVGVEVKSAAIVTRDDLRGLAALSKDPRFRRGYIVYTGTQIMRWPNNLWALPVSALWRDGAFA
ncbi:ATP-binding protein [Bifidobacterium xylocopae]|nr:AAA family ATPase [Bifidobacterium xylocopae]